LVDVSTSTVIRLNDSSASRAVSPRHSSGATAASVAMSAEVWSGVPTAAVAGSLAVEGTPWTPHRFRSDRGRRWFAEVTVSATPPVATVYEIADNAEDLLYITGLPALTAADVSIVIFGDRMGAVLSRVVSHPYMRLSIPSLETVDNAYRVGFVAFNVGHEVTRDTNYDSGFVDRYLPNTRATETVAGYTHVTVLGPEHPELRIAWGLQYRGASDYLDRVINLFRSLQGDSLPVVFWRDTDDPSSLGLYRVQGPPVKENSYGELSSELARVAQIILREETT
jgi:hypothetical protein